MPELRFVASYGLIFVLGLVGIVQGIAWSRREKIRKLRQRGIKSYKGRDIT